MAALLDGICTEQGKLRALLQMLLFLAAHLLDALLRCRLLFRRESAQLR